MPNANVDLFVRTYLCDQRAYQDLFHAILFKLLEFFIATGVHIKNHIMPIFWVLVGVTSQTDIKTYGVTNHAAGLIVSWDIGTNILSSLRQELENGEDRCEK